MHFYFDICIRPNPEFPVHQLMAAVFAKLHRVLTGTRTTSVGVIFPGYGVAPITLGDTLRLVGPQTDLVQLWDVDWLLGLREQAVLTALAPVPGDAPHRGLRRVQAKSNPERLLRRQMRRHTMTEEAARSTYDGMRAEHLRLPYVTLASGSTGQQFKLFLKLGPVEATSQAGVFNAYGLSQTATVAWF